MANGILLTAGETNQDNSFVYGRS